jgi:formylglycine-generating enzyme required for sulfatase activity
MTVYFWGDEIGKNNANCDACGSQWDNKQTAPVGSFGPNTFGIYDMSGNVWQWVEDCHHENYDAAPADGSAWIVGGKCRFRGLRGGSWLIIPRWLRSAQRFIGMTDGRGSSWGFRVARALSP